MPALPREESARKSLAWIPAGFQPQPGSPALCELLVLFPQQIIELIVNTINICLTCFLFVDDFPGQLSAHRHTISGAPEDRNWKTGIWNWVERGGSHRKLKPQMEEKLSRGEGREL